MRISRALSWIKTRLQSYGLDSSTRRVAGRYPEGASSNPARINIFQSTPAVSDYHEKFLFKYWLSFIVMVVSEKGKRGGEGLNKVLAPKGGAC